MNGIAEVVARLIPTIRHPITLAAFALFVVVFLLTQVILKSGVIPELAKSHGFKLLNKVLTVAGAALLLIIVLAFAAYFYTTKLAAQSRTKDVNAARRQIAALSAKATELAQQRVSLSNRHLLRELQPGVHAIGLILEPVTAINEIERLRARFGLPELTPALLAINQGTLEFLFENPFEYIPPGTTSSSDVYSARGWSSDQESAEGALEQEFIQILSDRPSFPYKDLILFLAGIRPADWDQPYPQSLVSDAAHYVPIRTALASERYDEAASLAHEFIATYAPQGHRHADDAGFLRALALSAMGQGLVAFRELERLRRLPDGDMSHKFGVLQRWIIEETMSDRDVMALEGDVTYRAIRPMLRFTRAHHLAARGDYGAAAQLLERLAADRSGICRLPAGTDGRVEGPAFLGVTDCTEEMIAETFSYSDQLPRGVPIDFVVTDLALFKELDSLSKDASAEGHFELGLRYFNDELIHYNRVLAEGRSWHKRGPPSYYETRNNFFLAAARFAESAAASQDSSIRQAAFYKLGRSYQHLTYSASFMIGALEGHDREAFGRMAVAAFDSAYAVHPSGQLADDALAEAGWNSWYLRGDWPGARTRLERVAKSFSNRNAADNAVYRLALIARERGDPTGMGRYWSQLGQMVMKSRLAEFQRRCAREGWEVARIEYPEGDGAERRGVTACPEAATHDSS